MPAGTTAAQKGKEGADAGGRTGRRRKDAVEEWGRERRREVGGKRNCSGEGKESWVWEREERWEAKGIVLGRGKSRGSASFLFSQLVKVHVPRTYYNL
jgi:hypothetical protein